MPETKKLQVVAGDQVHVVTGTETYDVITGEKYDGVSREVKKPSQWLDAQVLHGKFVVDNRDPFEGTNSTEIKDAAITSGARPTLSGEGGTSESGASVGKQLDEQAKGKDDTSAAAPGGSASTASGSAAASPAPAAPKA